MRGFKTPYKNDPFVIQISMALVGQKAVHVPVKCEPDAETAQCAKNVDAKVKKDGGGIVCGWQIVLLPDCYFDAIFHVVWRAPNGRLIDITPPQLKSLNQENTLFAEDKTYLFALKNERPTHRVFPVRAPRLWGFIIERCKMRDTLLENGRKEEARVVAKELETIVNAAVYGST
jgi:hypothetical protein